MPIEPRKIKMQRSALIISSHFRSGGENASNLDFRIVEDLKADESSNRRHKQDEKMGVPRPRSHVGATQSANRPID